MGSTRPMWIGLDLCNELGWVKFFFTHHNGLGQKISLIRPNEVYVSSVSKLEP